MIKKQWIADKYIASYEMKTKANSQSDAHNSLPLKTWPNPGKRNDKAAVKKVLRLKCMVAPLCGSYILYTILTTVTLLSSRV